MNHFKEQPKFEIRPTISQKPFESPAVQSFFTKWCEINDSIQPQFVTREQWDNRRTQGILEKRPDGKQTLFIPENLQLWEMIGVMEVIDKDTFATKPERANEAKEKMLALGRTFENAGVYIARRLDGIEDGREIAEALALEFYQYGQSLTKGKTQEISQIDEIKSRELTSEETETIDKFLAGDTLYESRKQRVKKLTAEDKVRKDELYERQRERTLAQFFRVAKKAFALESKSADGTLRESPTKLKPWQNTASIHSAFLKRIDRGLTKQIETPKREFGASIFRRGMELLQRNMPFDKLPPWVKDSYLHWQNGETTLREALKIDDLKTELDQIRQTGDIARIASKERKIADKIQIAVSKFPYQYKANNPSEMVANQYINCTGASTLGGALMKEAGLNYLVGDVPEHSILFLITSDGYVEWRDMLSASFNEHLTNKMIKGQRRDGKPLTVNDIVAFSQEPRPEGLMFDIDSPKYREKLSRVKEGQRQYVTVFEPEYGQQIQILYNTGIALNSLGRREEAVEAYRQATSLDPKYANPYYNLGITLDSLGRHEEAVEEYWQAIGINPEDAYPRYGLGNALDSLGRYEEAVEAYGQAIGLDPKFADPYNGLGNVLDSLGRKEEAVLAYQKFIDLADKKNDGYWIKRAKRIITKLKK